MKQTVSKSTGVGCIAYIPAITPEMISLERSWDHAKGGGTLQVSRSTTQHLLWRWLHQTNMDMILMNLGCLFWLEWMECCSFKLNVAHFLPLNCKAIEASFAVSDLFSVACGCNPAKGLNGIHLVYLFCPSPTMSVN